MGRVGKQQRKREHPCPHCLAIFQSPTKRDPHARAVHEKWRDYKCSHCMSLVDSNSAPLDKTIVSDLVLVAAAVAHSTDSVVVVMGWILVKRTLCWCVYGRRCYS